MTTTQCRNLVVLLTLLLFGASAGAEEIVIKPAAAPGPLDNPLKGWCPYTNAGKIHQPYSMVYRYVTWRELEPQPGKYRFAEWEKEWDEPAARGKHIVFRVHIDYPGRPTGMPQWLLDKGVRMTRYTEHGGGQSPDYDHPEMVAGMERLIAALGERYDKHPRVGFIQLGLLGFWGEWHTYPQNKLFASAETQKKVIDAYRKAFPNKILLARYPAGSAGGQAWLGYHDDMFPEDTDGPEEWKFLPKLRTAKCFDNWKKAAIGGEMVPGAAARWLGRDFAHTEKMVEQGHFSWIGPYNPALLEPPNAEYTARSQKLVRRMGYEYVLREIRYPAEVKQNETLAITIRGDNQGVAPFYYLWPVELALLDEQGKVVERLPLKADIREWLPGSFTLNDTPKVTAKPGQYQLALTISDPGSKAAAIGFANDLRRHEGWTVISKVTIVGQ